MSTKAFLAAAAGLALLALGGCIEREERIEIALDGSVTVTHVFRGDLHDLKGGLAAAPVHGYRVKSHAMPEKDPRRAVYDQFVKLGHPEVVVLLPKIVLVLKQPAGDSGGHSALFTELKKIDDPDVQRAVVELWKALNAKAHELPKHVHEAVARYGSVSEMPSTFAKPGGKAAAQALRWRDRVESRREAGRKVHTFTRTYEARRWGRYAFGEKRWVAKAVPDLMRWSRLSTARKLELTRDLLAWERFKHEEFVGAAIRAVVPDHPRRVEALLAAGAVLRERTPGPEEILRLVRLPAGELKKRSRAILAGLKEAALLATVRTLDLDEAAMARLKDAYRDARFDFEVTDDLSDETFRVRLALPGKVLSHNGDDLTGRTVTFAFDGKDLRDRDHELAVVWETE